MKKFFVRRSKSVKNFEASTKTSKSDFFFEWSKKLIEEWSFGASAQKNRHPCGLRWHYKQKASFWRATAGALTRVENAGLGTGMGQKIKNLLTLSLERPKKRVKTHVSPAKNQASTFRSSFLTASLISLLFNSLARQRSHQITKAFWLIKANQLSTRILIKNISAKLQRLHCLKVNLVFVWLCKFLGNQAAE